MGHGVLNSTDATVVHEVEGSPECHQKSRTQTITAK